MWLLKQSIKTIPRGILAGTIVTAYEFSNEDPGEAERNTQLHKMYDFLASTNLKSNTIMLMGSFTRATAFMFDGIVRSLVKANKAIVVLTDGQAFMPFFNAPGVYTIVELKTPEWNNFPCNEVHYHLKKGCSLEPQLPAKDCMPYLVPGDITDKALITFVATSKIAWKVSREINYEWLLGEKEE